MNCASNSTPDGEPETANGGHIDDIENGERQGDESDKDSVSSTLEHAPFLELPEYSTVTSQRYENGGTRQIPNSCAICLDNYHVGDHLIWSANVGCSHAFHELCIVTWCHRIIKDQPGTNHCVCPCCRQEFVKVDSEEEENGDSEQQLDPSPGVLSEDL